jgi:hypothetical protein
MGLSTRYTTVLSAKIRRSDPGTYARLTSFRLLRYGRANQHLVGNNASEA